MSITAITPRPGDGRDVGHLLPGFVDAHVHLESSLLTPAEFARVAVRHGTVAAVSDPHEIANVLGIAGVRWMVDDARRTPFTVVFGAPSCVPATVHETAGATLALHEVEELLDTPGVGYLAEVMDYPGVLARDPRVLGKVDAALRRGLPVDHPVPGTTTVTVPVTGRTSMPAGQTAGSTGSSSSRSSRRNDLMWAKPRRSNSASRAARLPSATCSAAASRGHGRSVMIRAAARNRPPPPRMLAWPPQLSAIWSAPMRELSYWLPGPD